MRDMWRGKFVTVILSAFVAFTVLSGVAAAADNDFKQFGIRVRGLVVIPDQKPDATLSSLRTEASMAEAPELDLEYFFTRNISSELILGVTKHDLHATGKTIGSTWLLPPTLTVKYHPLAGAKISPYVGFGVNYIIPFKTKIDGGVVDPNARIDNSIGWAAQAGADVALGNNWYFNVDFKYLNADTKLVLPAVDNVKHELDLNPYVAGVGVGYRF